MCSFKNGLLTTKFGAQINELKAEVAREQEVGAESESHQNAQMAEATAQVCVIKGIYISAHIYTRVHKHTLTHTHACAQTHANMHKHICRHMYTYVQINIELCIYRYMCVRQKGASNMFGPTSD